MDNVVLKSTFEFPNYGKVVNFPKRIKLSNTSNDNVHAKVQSLSDSEKSSNGEVIPFPQTYLEQSKISESEESSNGEVIPFPQKNGYPVKDEEDKDISEVASVLGNINLESSNYYTSQPINSLSSRLIRLTDVMYNRVVEHTVAVQQNDTIAFEEISQGDKDSSVSSDNIDDKSLDSETMKSAVDVAFASTPVDTPEKQDDAVVKKASYTKARVKKYQVDSKLPTNMISGNELFQSDTTVSSSESIKDDAISREVPIVVPDRKDKFLFNDLNLTSEVSESAKDIEASDVSIADFKKIQISSEDDADFEELLAKVEKRLHDQEASHSKKMDAEKEFQSSVEVLKTAAQRYDVSSEALEEVKEKAYAYLNEIEANIKNNMKKEQELRVMTEQQIQEARKIEAAADRNEAHIEQFNSVLAIVPDGQAKSASKSYTRAA